VFFHQEIEFRLQLSGSFTFSPQGSQKQLDLLSLRFPSEGWVQQRLNRLWLLQLWIQLFVGVDNLSAEDHYLTSLVLLKIVIFVKLVNWLFWLLLILVLFNLLFR
jgi:hypothetical protein